MKTEIIQVTCPADVAPAAETGAEVLRAGGLVAFPTETVYGLGACAAHEETMARLRRLKDRPAQPFTAHIGRREQAFQYVADPAATARRLMDKAWPGPLTLVLPTGGRLAEPRWGEAVCRHVCYQGSVGLRLPDEPVAQRMLAAVVDPVVAPSANPAGEPPPTSAEQVLATLDGRIDLLIDAGTTRIRQASTIARVDPDGTFEVLREGVITKRELELLSQRQILFVCTGNTCRSPMAEGIARVELAARLGCLPVDLPKAGWRILSAGMTPVAGAPATPPAIDAAAALGADISDHRNQPVTEQLINSSDLIFCLTDGHVEQVRAIAPNAADRVRLLDETGDIPDPIGGSGRVYRRTAERIRQAVRNQLDRIVEL